MGFSDEDYDNVAQTLSDCSIYHISGDSICTTVLVALIGKLLDYDYYLIIKNWERQYLKALSKNKRNRIIIKGNLNRPGFHNLANRVYSTDGMSPTLNTKCGQDAIIYEERE